MNGRSVSLIQYYSLTPTQNLEYFLGFFTTCFELFQTFHGQVQGLQFSTAIFILCDFELFSGGDSYLATLNRSCSERARKTKIIKRKSSLILKGSKMLKPVWDANNRGCVSTEVWFIEDKK
jgi:hypothetical protein